jgi:hypothetical protein
MNAHDRPSERIKAAAFQIAYVEEWDRQFAALPEEQRRIITERPEGDEAAKFAEEIEAKVSAQMR